MSYSLNSSLMAAIDPIESLAASLRTRSRGSNTQDDPDATWSAELRVLGPVPIELVIPQYMAAVEAFDWTGAAAHAGIVQRLREAADDVRAGEPDPAGRLLAGLPLLDLLGPDLGVPTAGEVGAVCRLMTGVQACVDALEPWYEQRYPGLDIHWDDGQLLDELDPIIAKAAELMHRRGFETVPDSEWFGKNAADATLEGSREGVGLLCLRWLVERGLTDDLRDRLLDRVRDLDQAARARTEALAAAGFPPPRPANGGDMPEMNGAVAPEGSSSESAIILLFTGRVRGDA